VILLAISSLLLSSCADFKLPPDQPSSGRYRRPGSGDCTFRRGLRIGILGMNQPSGALRWFGIGATPIAQCDFAPPCVVESLDKRVISDRDPQPKCQPRKGDDDCGECQYQRQQKPERTLRRRFHVL
jgi:hypothetical protein